MKSFGWLAMFLLVGCMTDDRDKGLADGSAVFTLDGRKITAWARADIDMIPEDRVVDMEFDWDGAPWGLRLYFPWTLEGTCGEGDCSIFFYSPNGCLAESLQLTITRNVPAHVEGSFSATFTCTGGTSTISNGSFKASTYEGN